LQDASFLFCFKAGVTHLRDLQTPDRFEQAVSQDGVTVITTKTSSTILCQQPAQAILPRSADHILIRSLAALSVCTTYVLNYLELGRAPTWNAYSWLGIATFILAFRFCGWAIRPHSSKKRIVLHLRSTRPLCNTRAIRVGHLYTAMWCIPSTASY